MIPRITLLFLCFLAWTGFSPEAGASLPIQGSWIWKNGEASPRNAYVYFRRTFSLDAAPRSATCRVTADSRYILYVNGQRVGRGPARSHRTNLAFDTWNLLPYLNRGNNTVAALVHHYGESTFQYQKGRGGFLFDATILTRATTNIVSDKNWKAKPATAWYAPLERMNLQLGYPEVFDARQAPDGWMNPGFDDASWPSASVLGPAGMEPWPQFSPSNLPPPSEQVLLPTAVIDTMEVETVPSAGRIDFYPLFDRKGWSTAYAETWLYAPSSREVVLETGSDDALKVWLNDRVVLERPVVRKASPAQDRTRVRLYAGWNRLLVKVVQLVGPWEFFFGLTGPGAQDVYFSSTRSSSVRDTWRVSNGYAFDGSGGVLTGYSTNYPPENGATSVVWQTITAPIGPLPHVATVMRAQNRDRGKTPLLRNARTLTSAAASSVFSSTSTRNGAVLLDFGKEVTGYPRITLTGASGGEIVDVGYAEVLEDKDGQPLSPASGASGLLNPQRSDVQYADRFICRPGTNVFETFDKRAFRYLQVDIRNCPQSVTLAGVSITLSTYPAPEIGAFYSSDARLNAIWDTGRWTLRLNMDDAYTDCPWRERAVWLGDVYIEALANYYAFGDTALIRRTLSLVPDSVNEEGLVLGVLPTEWDSARIPSYSLLWIMTVRDYYLYSGDDSILRPMLSAMAGTLAFCDARRDPATGLLKDVPYWVFIDWAPGMDGQRIGISGSLNAFYYRALLAAADVATAVGESGQAAIYQARAAAIQSAFNTHLWNESRGVYWDTLKSGVPDGRISQHVNALAVAYDIAPKDRWKRILDRLLSDPTLMQVGTPYFSSFVLEALYAGGRHDEALAMIRNRWGGMLDWGATTWWEKWEPTDSLCHGWSTAPTRDLPAQWAGIRPTKPGFREWVMAPVWSGLTRVDATVPTPFGTIQGSWTRETSLTQVTVTVPQGTTGRLRIPVAGLESAAWTVNGSASLPSGFVRETEAGYWTVRISQPGTYIVRAAS